MKSDRYSLDRPLIGFSWFSSVLLSANWNRFSPRRLTFDMLSPTFQGRKAPVTAYHASNASRYYTASRRTRMAWKQPGTAFIGRWPWQHITSYHSRGRQIPSETESGGSRNKSKTRQHHTFDNKRKSSWSSQAVSFRTKHAKRLSVTFS